MSGDHLQPETTAGALQRAWLTEALAGAIFDATARAEDNILGYEDQGEMAREHYLAIARDVEKLMRADGWTFTSPSQNKRGYRRVIRALAQAMRSGEAA